MTAYTVGANQAGPAILIEVDGLVTAVKTADGAAAAAQALFQIKLWERDGGAVQIICTGEVLQTFAHQFMQALISRLFQETGQTAGQICDDAVTVLHDGSGHLEIGAAQRQKFGRVMPGLNAAHARDRDAGQIRADRHVVDKAQGNGFDCIAGIAGNDGFAVNGGLRRQRGKGQPGNRLDSVDGGQPIGAGSYGGQSGKLHI